MKTITPIEKPIPPNPEERVNLTKEITESEREQILKKEIKTTTVKDMLRAKRDRQQNSDANSQKPSSQVTTTEDSSTDSSLSSEDSDDDDGGNPGDTSKILIETKTIPTASPPSIKLDPQKSPAQANGNNVVIKEPEIAKLPTNLDANCLESIKKLIMAGSTDQSNFFQTPTIDLLYG